MIGRGGMGEVYRARDSRLARDVALKMLPDGEVSDPEWRTRFEREARALGSLNHPNIAAIYGLEAGLPERGGASTTVIVMELVDGETLADRLTHGPLPVDEALKIAAQLAEALEAAHQKGIVHRDLKPANVKITSTGTVKVLDFGLARFLVQPGHEEVTLSGMTAPAVVLGTPAYMAPEQAQGRSADRRVDVWAFGVVLYEMVTGERPFRGASVQDTLAAVLTADPEWERVPLAVQPLLRACLDRDPRKRLRDIADYRFLLTPSDGAPVPPPRSRRASLMIAAAAFAVVVLAFLAGKTFTPDDGEAQPPATTRTTAMLPAGVSVTRGPAHTSSVAVSPDGRTVVIAASDKEGQRLYRRSLDRLEPVPIAGTERGLSPFFSWDGNWIGFFADGRLKRIPATGGAAVDIAAAPGYSAGASWGPDDRIVFAFGADAHLQVVPARGGAVEPLGTSEAGGRHPEVLPDGRTVLFEWSEHIHAYDRQTGATKKLVAGTAPRYSDGRVIFSRGTTLLAAPLNLKDRSVGAAVAVAEGVAVESASGSRHYAISRTGTLAHVPAPETYELVVVGADAAERVLGKPERSLENPRFSPNGRSVVVGTRRRDNEPVDLWLHDLQTGTASRLTLQGGRAPIWADNDNTISYSHLGAQQGIYTIRGDGGGESTLLLPLATFHWLVGWTPDGSTLLYGLMSKSTSSILAYSNGQSRTVVGPGNTWGGRLSRDGKWLAYYVLNSGTFETYVTTFPDGRTPWLVAEGTDPSWGPDGNEIYYRSGSRLLAARIDKTAGVKVVATRVVVDPFLPPLYDDYDIHRDGRTLVMVRPANRTQGREITMVLGWSREFRP